MWVLGFLGGLTSFASLLILAVGIGTNHWINFQKASAKLNPVLVNDQLQNAAGFHFANDSTLTIRYNVRHYGLWVGCYMERQNRTMSCTYIGSRCYTNVCWIRRTGSQRQQQTCKDTRMLPLTKCGAFQFVRVLICLAIIGMIIGTSTQIVSAIIANSSLAAMSGITIFVSGFLVMVGFSVFYSVEFAKNQVNTIGSVGYSLILVAVSWPLMFFAGVLACWYASAESEEEKNGFSSSNF